MPTNWGSRSFNGTSDAITVTSASPLSITGSITLACWFQIGVTGSFEPLVVKPHGATWVSPFTDYMLRVQSSNVLFGSVTNAGVNVITGTTTFSTNTWYHGTFTFDGNHLNLYVNGVSDATQTNFSGAITAGGQNLLLGKDISPAFLNGKIADAAIWNTNLTASEILALGKYGARPNTIRPANLAAWWPLDGLQSPEEDLSSFKNNGTLTGTTPAFGPPYAPLTPRWPQFLPSILLPPATPWGSRSFNGTSDQIVSANTYLTNLTSNSSLFAWIYPTSTPHTYNAICCQSGANGVISLLLKSTGKGAYYVENSSGSNVSVDPGSGTPTLNAWNSIGLSYANGALTSYLNGAVDGTSSAGAGIHSASLTMNIGWDAFSAGRNFTGRIADVAQWSVPLTASEMVALNQGARPYTIRPGSLVCYFPLDGLQSPEPDLSGKGNAGNGTLTGTTPAFGPPYAPLTPRWPQKIVEAAAAPTFNPAWARGKNIVIEGVAT